MEFADGVLRALGAFYAFAGFVATRAGLTSLFIDKAIAAISLKKTSKRETLQSAWLLISSAIVLLGGLLLVVLSEFSVFVFMISSVSQLFYVYWLAPAYFDVEDPPDAGGRRSTSTAMVLYIAVSAFVVWAFVMGRLHPWSDLTLLGQGLVIAGFGAYAAHTVWMLLRPIGGSDSSSASDSSGAGAEDEPGDWDEALPEAGPTTQYQVMADYDCNPLWALDGGGAYNTAPEDLGLSDDLVRDLAAWTEAYSASFDRDDPVHSLWSAEQQLAHVEEGKQLARRLAQERPDLTFFVVGENGALVPVLADGAG